MDDSITVREAGRRGGLKVKETYGPEHYVRIGALGGKAVAAQRGPGFFSAIGKKGGAALKASRTQNYYRDIGAAGGAVVLERYGRDYYSRIGALGAVRRKELGYPPARVVGSRPRVAKRASPRAGRKLNLKKARAIRAAYPGVGTAELARQYGVSRPCIYLVLSGTTWPEVP